MTSVLIYNLLSVWTYQLKLLTTSAVSGTHDWLLLSWCHSDVDLLLVHEAAAVHQQRMILQETRLTLGDQSRVWRSFSLVVSFVFRRLIGWWRVDTVNTGTEVKCYQFIWSLRERCWFQRTMTSPGEEVTGRTVCTWRQNDLWHSNNIWTWTDSNPETAGNIHLLMVTSPSSWPRSFQTSVDPVELQVESSGLRGTESLRLRPQQLRNWSDVSLNRDETSVSDLSCERSL